MTTSAAAVELSDPHDRPAGYAVGHQPRQVAARDKGAHPHSSMSSSAMSMPHMPMEQAVTTGVAERSHTAPAGALGLKRSATRMIVAAGSRATILRQVEALKTKVSGRSRYVVDPRTSKFMGPWDAANSVRLIYYNADPSSRLRNHFATVDNTATPLKEPFPLLKSASSGLALGATVHYRRV